MQITELHRTKSHYKIESNRGIYLVDAVDTVAAHFAFYRRVPMAVIERVRYVGEKEHGELLSRADVTQL